MIWSQLGLAANLVLTACYMAVAWSILRPLADTGQLWRNRLGLFTGIIFFTCIVGHGIHADHAVRLLIDGGWGAVGIDWHLGVWDALTAVCALAYWRLRQLEGPPVDAGTMFEDLRRRQAELEAEASEAALRAELAVQRELLARQSFALAFDSAPGGMALLDGAGLLVRVNPAFARIVGQSDDALVGLALADLLVAEPGATPLALGSDQAGAEPVEVQLDRREGPPAWVRVWITPLADGQATILVQLEDVTAPRLAQARLNHLALHDPLTGLPNRLLFHDRAATALRHAKRTGTWTACLFIDLDHFKVVNDSLGHAAGDRVLKDVADRLVALLRPGDTVARMGGDEFCLLLQDLSEQEEAGQIAERVVTALDGFVDIDGMQVTTGVSVGVAVVQPGDRVTSQTLVRDADTALYRAKGNGRGHQVVFDDALRFEAERRLRVEAELRRGIARGEIGVWYQAQWSLSRRRIVGVEALVRWHHPTLGMLEPAEFLPVALETGLVVELGAVVLERAVRDLTAWRSASPDLTLSVNLSSRQLGRPGFVETVRSLMADAGLPCEALCLELTETDLTALGRSALRTLDELRSLGVRLAVDDVGTGQSSLTHLVTLPIDVIKIDRTFVDHVHVPGAKRAVVDALLSLARTIGVHVVAEGAETIDQVTTLEALGCDVVQGYIVSRPLDADSFATFLDRGAITTAVPLPAAD
jgi:diguanylate cyclase (GGDEF)-like protein/PAS domain S-box-containing protein